MPSTRVRKPAIPRLPEFLLPLRYVPRKATTDIREGKFHTDSYEHLPLPAPYTPESSTCIFMTHGITFYVPFFLYRIAKKVIGFGLEALFHLRRNEALAWEKATVEMSPIEYENKHVACEVQFRSSDSDIVVRFRIDADRLIVSLPHPSKWQPSGLEWLTIH